MTTALDRLLERPPHTGLHSTTRIVMLVLICFLLWAFFAELEEVAVAEGEVVPQEQIQAVQHLEGGIIEEIHVFEGDRVQKGQPLMQLNITPFRGQPRGAAGTGAGTATQESAYRGGDCGGGSTYLRRDLYRIP